VCGVFGTFSQKVPRSKDFFFPGGFSLSRTIKEKKQKEWENLLLEALPKNQ